MMMPVVIGESLFDDFLSNFPDLFSSVPDFFNNIPKLRDAGSIMKSPAPLGAPILMKADVQEKDGKYEIAIDVPGFSKDEVSIELDSGRMTVKAEKKEDKEEKDDSGKMIRRERWSGSMQRSFYVGNEVSDEDVSAKYENGVLKISIAKKTPEVPEKKTIAIEG